MSLDGRWLRLCLGTRVASVGEGGKRFPGEERQEKEKENGSLNKIAHVKETNPVYKERKKKTERGGAEDPPPQKKKREGEPK